MDRVPGHLLQNYQEVISSLVWVKLAGTGNTGAGKTSLIKHFCESKFSSGYQPTVGVDYGFRIQSVNGTELRVHMWDLSGGSEYAEVRNELYSGSDAIFIAFDVTSVWSFESLDFWIGEAKRFATGRPDIFIVANKTDLKEKRVVSESEGRKYSQQNHCLYFETSAATGEGVDELFQQILQEVFKKRKTMSARADKEQRFS